jgi:lysozyme family protein
MSSDGLSTAMRFILKWEGGFVADPDDHGGRTNEGVTQAVYDAWRASKGLPSRDVKDIGDDEVAGVYEQNYWQPAACPSLRTKLDLVQFDTAVNMGTRRAMRILQQAVGTGVDGQFGPTTLQTCGACDLGGALIAYCKIREGFYRGFAQAPNQAKFLKGWLNRLDDLRREIGLPGFESAQTEPDFGDTGYIARIPDLSEGTPLETWQHR